MLQELRTDLLSVHISMIHRSKILESLTIHRFLVIFCRILSLKDQTSTRHYVCNVQISAKESMCCPLGTFFSLSNVMNI